MNATQPIITSSYGNRVLHWQRETLHALLTELRAERERHKITIELDSAEAEHNALMAKAELIKQRATRAISEAQSQHA